MWRRLLAGNVEKDGPPSSGRSSKWISTPVEWYLDEGIRLVLVRTWLPEEKTIPSTVNASVDTVLTNGDAPCTNLKCDCQVICNCRCVNCHEEHVVPVINCCECGKPTDKRGGNRMLCPQCYKEQNRERKAEATCRREASSENGLVLDSML